MGRKGEGGGSEFGVRYSGRPAESETRKNTPRTANCEPANGGVRKAEGGRFGVRYSVFGEPANRRTPVFGHPANSELRIANLRTANSGIRPPCEQQSPGFGVRYSEFGEPANLRTANSGIQPPREQRIANRRKANGGVRYSATPRIANREPANSVVR